MNVGGGSVLGFWPPRYSVERKWVRPDSNFSTAESLQRGLVLPPTQVGPIDFEPRRGASNAGRNDCYAFN